MLSVTKNFENQAITFNWILTLGIVEAGRLITVISHKEQREWFWDNSPCIGQYSEKQNKTLHVSCSKHDSSLGDMLEGRQVRGRSPDLDLSPKNSEVSSVPFRLKHAIVWVGYLPTPRLQCSCLASQIFIQTQETQVSPFQNGRNQAHIFSCVGLSPTTRALMSSWAWYLYFSSCFH